MSVEWIGAVTVGDLLVVAVEHTSVQHRRTRRQQALLVGDGDRQAYLAGHERVARIALGDGETRRARVRLGTARARLGIVAASLPDDQQRPGAGERWRRDIDIARSVGVVSAT